MMLFASANRDERAFDRPDAFDVTRDPRRHLGFHAGIHMCLGRHLAQLEKTAILKAMLARVEKIEIGEPTVALNNTIYRSGTLPARFRGDGGAAIAKMGLGAGRPTMGHHIPFGLLASSRIFK